MNAAALTSVDTEKEAKPLQYAAFLTKHHKVPLVAPALAEVGIMVQLTDLFDTDSLGSFSGEIPRTLSPLACVKTKAKNGV
ncbi:hypothetical protein [Arsukibacterium sp.]|uniref:hypothetical protein n=1 Tax=Arsukibacterium sp. TaxID=1977258 RepID=UPI002FDAB1A5